MFFSGDYNFYTNLSGFLAGNSYEVENLMFRELTLNRP